MAKEVVKIKGEYTYPSEFTEVPPGGLELAQNCNVDRDSVAEPRNGLKTYKAISNDSEDRADSIYSFNDTLITNYGSELSKDGTDPFTQILGTFNPPSHGDSYIPKIKYQEANENLYFTSGMGIMKMSAIAGAVTSAGAPRGLDMQLTLGVTGAGFMATNSQVGYRGLWAKKDANKNLVLGAPGQRVTLANASGNAQDTTITSTIPAGVDATWLFQLYRSPLSGSSTTEPTDELGLVFEGSPSAADLAAGYITVLDSTPDDLRGASLYTNSSQEGIGQANDQPPSAKDMALFKNFLILANTIQKQNLTITLLAAYGASGINIRTFTGNISTGTNTILLASSTTGLAVGQSITGVGIPASTTITLIVGATITISQNATATTVGLSITAFDVLTIAGRTYTAAAAEDVALRKFKVFTAGTPSQNIADTAQSLCKIINRDTGNTLVYAFYLSGLDELPGKIFLEARSPGAAAFTALASSHGNSWNPHLPTSGTTVQSEADEFKNRLHISKIEQPEAFPRTQYFAAGAENKAVLRIHALRESVIIEKEDGVYRLTGTDPTNFNIDILDSTAILLAPESSVVLNNQVHCLTNQGISTINDSAVGVISRPIEDQIAPMLQWSNLKETCFGIAYETARKYLLAVPEGSEAEFASKIHVFNTFTRAFSHWLKPVTSGYVNPTDDKLYLGSAVVNTIFQERKSGTFRDLADDELTVTITDVDGAVLTLTSTTEVEVGDVLEQGDLPFTTIIEVDEINDTITLNVARAWVNGDATLQKHFDCKVKFLPLYMGDPGILKQVSEIKPLFKDLRFELANMVFSSELVLVEDEVEISGYRSVLYGFFPWGSVPWGGISGSSPKRVFVPAEYQHCSWLNVAFEHSGAFGKFAIAGLHILYEPLTTATEGAES